MYLVLLQIIKIFIASKLIVSFPDEISEERRMFLTHINRWQQSKVVKYMKSASFKLKKKVSTFD